MSNKQSLVRLNAAAKRQAVVDARAAGHTWRQVAQIVGYASPESAMRAFNQACAMLPQQSVHELIAQETARLDACDERLSQIIANPPIKTTSIGKTQWDPRTCRCDAKASTTKDHADDCPVIPVFDMGAVTTAIKERRLIGESLRRMRGADRPQDADESEAFESAMSYVRELAARVKTLEGDNAELTRLLAAYETGTIVPAQIVS